MDYRDQAIEYSKTNILSLVFLWMSLALGLSFAVAYLAAFISPFKEIITKNYILYLLISSIGQLALVVIISGFIRKLSFIYAAFLFILFSFLMGITLSSIFFVYKIESIISTFLIASLTFAVMGIYGLITKSDLSRFSNIVNMTLIGLLISGLVNMFLVSTKLDFISSAIGVLLFSFLTALNIQQIKYLTNRFDIEHEEKNKISLIGALSLYLNFINIFLHLLKFTGERKDRKQ